MKLEVVMMSFFLLVAVLGLTLAIVYLPVVRPGGGLFILVFGMATVFFTWGLSSTLK